MAEKLIYEIKNVEIGDIVYYEGAENGAVVVVVDPNNRTRLKIKTPVEFQPFNAYGATAVWLQDSYFRYAIRQTQDKLVKKSLKAMNRIPKKKRVSPFDWFDWNCQNCGMTQLACLSASTPCCALCSHAPEDKEVYEEVQQ